MCERIRALLPCPTLRSIFDFIYPHITQRRQSQQPDDIQQLPRYTACRRKAGALPKQVFQKRFSFPK
jgi:hypothetical protein